MSARPSIALVVLTLVACGAPTATTKCGTKQCSSTQRCDLSTQLCVQDSPPVVTLDPVPGVAYGPTQRLTGRVTDDVHVERVEVSIDDGMTWSPAELNGETFSVTVELPPLDLKALAVRARAFDSLGQRGESSDSIRVDDVGPTIALAAPQQAVRGPQVALELDVTDAAGVQSVSADFGDGKALAATLDGTVWKVSGPVPSRDGAPVPIGVSATDSSGNTSTGQVSVTVDAVGPRGAFASPLAGAIVSGAALRVSGAVSDGSGVASVRVKLDGSAGDAEATVTGATWTASLPLPQENGVQHDLVATFTDTLGNSSEARLAVTVDTVAPQPMLVEPAVDALVATAQLTVQLVAVGGASSVSVSLGAQPAVSAAAQGGDVWVATLPVPMEDFTPETLSVVAVDVAGNRGLATRSLHVDRVAPTVTIGAPTAGQKLNAASFAGTDAVTVSFSATDGDPQLTIEGFDGSAWHTGSSSFPVVTSPTDNPRSYPVRARATDRAGNVTSVNWTFSVDRVAPTATVTPADGTRNVEPRQAGVIFSEPVFGATPLTEPLSLSPAAPAPGSWSAAHDSFVSGALSPYTVYQAKLVSGLADDSGNPVVAVPLVRFHTAANAPASGTVLATGVQNFKASSNQDGVLLVALDQGTSSAESWSAYAWDPVTAAQGSYDYLANVIPATGYQVLSTRTVAPDLSAVTTNQVNYANLGGSFTQFAINGVPQANTRSIAVVPTPPMPGGVDGTAPYGLISDMGTYTRDTSVTVSLGSIPFALSSGTSRWTAWGQDNAQNLTLAEYGCGYSGLTSSWSCSVANRSLPSIGWDATAVVSPSGRCEVASTATAGGRMMSSSTWSCGRGGCGASALATQAAPGDHLQLAPFAGNGEDAVVGAWQLPGNAGVQLGKLAASSCGGSFVPYGAALAGAYANFRPVQLGNRPALLYIDSAGNLKVYVP